MAEQYVEPEDFSADSLNNVIHIDPRPVLAWDEKMRRIGARVISIKKSDDGATEFSHNPISVINEYDGSTAVYFEKFQTDYKGNEVGIPFHSERNGLETRSVFIARFNASTHTVDTHELHPRNYRYVLPRYESRKVAGTAETESEYFRHFLWHNPADTDAQE